MSGGALNRFKWAAAFEPTKAERKVIDGAAAGDVVVFQETAEIRAECLRILLLGLRPDWPVTHKGVEVIGPQIPGGKEAKLRITGDLDLSFARAADGGALPRLSVRNCAFDGPVRLTGGHFAELNFEKGRNLGLVAVNCSVEGQVRLDGAHLIGGTCFSGAIIQGQFSANDAMFCNNNGEALRLDGARLENSLFLNKARFDGAVDCAGATIKGQFAAQSATYKNLGGDALRLQGAEIDGDVFIDCAAFEGRADFSGVTINGQFSAKLSKFNNPDDTALRLQGATINGGVYLDNARSAGLANFRNANIKSEFGASGAKLCNSNGVALCFQGSNIMGEVFLRDAHIIGGFSAAFSQLRSLTIDKTLLKANSSISSLDLYRATISGAMRIGSLKSDCDGRWSLNDAHIDKIDDDLQTGWPLPGLLDLDGLTYRTINAPGSDDKIVQNRIAWLKRQYEGGEPKRGEFRPQPFEQLARVLRAHGQVYAAQRIEVAKRMTESRCSNKQVDKFFSFILRHTCKYGYSPLRAILVCLIWIAVGALLIKLALQRNMFERATAGAAEAVHLEPISYAFDLAIPIFDFGQASAYQLEPHCLQGGWLCGGLELLEVAYGLLGFLLFSILVLTLTGLLRQEKN